MLTGNQADPGGELPAVFELPAVTYSSDDRERGGGPNAADLHQALRELALACLGFQLAIVGLYTHIEQA